MRVTVLSLICLSTVSAQPRAGTPLHPGGAPGPKSPTPSVLRPGTPTQTAAPARQGFSNGSAITRPGSVGNPAGQGVRRQTRRPVNTILVPYYASPYYGPSAPNGYPDEQPAPVSQYGSQGVYLNREYQPERINPVMRDYSNAPLPETMRQEHAPLQVYDAPVNLGNQRDDEPTIYLLALKDQNVIPALAYWVEGDTLRYVTRQHAINLISLDLIDRDFSMKLNRERNIEFKLP